VNGEMCSSDEDDDLRCAVDVRYNMAYDTYSCSLAVSRVIKVTALVIFCSCSWSVNPIMRDLCKQSREPERSHARLRGLRAWPSGSVVRVQTLG
jgi:hypothetical protein